MKFQVSVLSDKGVKKLVATVDADRFEEEAGASRNALLTSYQTRLRFYSNDSGTWRKREILTASLLLDGSYVVEQVAA